MEKQRLIVQVPDDDAPIGELEAYSAELEAYSAEVQEAYLALWRADFGWQHEMDKMKGLTNDAMSGLFEREERPS